MAKINDAKTGAPPSDDDVGRYRIQAVADMTQISAATLRAWERRYGIPRPQRTASAYRLYSDRDIEMVRRVRELCDGGMAPSQAAQIVLASTSGEPAGDPIQASPRPEPARAGDVYALAVDRIIEAVERFDADALEAAVQRATFLGPSVTVFEQIFAPAMTLIGKRWEDGTLGIGQEHLASEAIAHAVRQILRIVQPEGSRRVAVLACFADEEHLTPLLGIALRFAEWGFKAVILGPRTPPHALRQAVAEVAPDLVGLSVSILPPPYRARELLEGYAEACGDIPWIVGGSASAALADAVKACGGLVASADLQRLQHLIEGLGSGRAAPRDH